MIFVLNKNTMQCMQYKELACHSRFQDFNYPTLVNCTLILCSAKIMLHTTLVSHMKSSVLTVNIPGHSEKKNKGEKLNKNLSHVHQGNHEHDYLINE